MEEFGFHRFDHVQKTVLQIDGYFLDPIDSQRFIGGMIGGRFQGGLSVENDNFIN